VFGVGDAPRDIKPVIRALRPVASDAPAALPRPVFSRTFWSRLGTFERVHRRLRNIAATGRELGVAPRAVRDKLALARLLRAHDIRRRATCR
jgi:hypothetical protein